MLFKIPTLHLVHFSKIFHRGIWILNGAAHCQGIQAMVCRQKQNNYIHQFINCYLNSSLHINIWSYLKVLSLQCLHPKVFSVKVHFKTCVLGGPLKEPTLLCTWISEKNKQTNKKPLEKCLFFNLDCMQQKIHLVYKKIFFRKRGEWFCLNLLKFFRPCSNLSLKRSPTKSLLRWWYLHHDLNMFRDIFQYHYSCRCTPGHLIGTLGGKKYVKLVVTFQMTKANL